MDVHKTLYPFYATTKILHVAVTITKMRFVGSNSKIYCDNFHSTLSADYHLRVRLSSKHCDELQRKKHCHCLQRNHKLWLYFTQQAESRSDNIFAGSQNDCSLMLYPNMSLKISGWEDCPVDLPCMVAGSASKTFLSHIEIRAANVWDLVQSDKENVACLC